MAVVLSAQATDTGVNKATPALFALADTPEKMMAIGEEGLVELIRTIGLFRTKAKNLMALSRVLVEQYGSEVPRDRIALEALPGVGRKTANVVLGHAFDVPGLPVDRHVLRVTNRLGLAHGDDPVAVEKQLTGLIPKDRWTVASDTFILHGRRICRPKPLCDRCAVKELCKYFQRLGPKRTKTVQKKSRTA